MFGYVTIYQKDLDNAAMDCYQAYYCGLCQSLGRKYGTAARMALSYDMTFAALLLTALYDPPTQTSQGRCAPHPLRTRPRAVNEFTDYAADMTVVLAYYNYLDDWQDERKRTSYTAAKILRKSFLKVSEQYPRQTKAVKEYLKKIHECENRNSADMDLAAGLTGEALGEIYAYKDDIWSEDLRQLGFYLGKFIYLMDAYEDLEKDKKSGNYNPYKFIGDLPEFDKTAEDILTMMAASASKAFEKLPILENVDILRNILYIGILSLIHI